MTALLKNHYQNPMTYTDGNGNRLEVNDVFKTMSNMEDNSVDLIIADPPYFQVYGDFDFGVFKTEKDYVEWCKEWLFEAKRVLKPEGTLILWGSVGKRQITFARLAIMIEDEEIFVRQNWITQRNTRGIGSTKNYMSAREDILFLTKSDKYTFNIPYSDEKSQRKDLGANGKPRKNTHKRVSNVWSDITEASQSSIERCEHPTVKAQKLCDRLISTHSNQGDVVFIPFVGSGSEIISAINNDRKFIGCEISEKYMNLTIERIYNLAGVQLHADTTNPRNRSRILRVPNDRVHSGSAMGA
jgi:site-specific DNA-methyltransferase (adenine-specific)